MITLFNIILTEMFLLIPMVLHYNAIVAILIRLFKYNVEHLHVHD